MTLPNRFDAVPLAITGIGLRLPGADGLDSYWELLRSGRHAIAPLPASRLNRERYYQPGAASPGKTYSQIGGTVPDEELDPTGLALSESELRSADPAHLWFLHTALAALRHAGIDPDRLAGQRLGIFVGHARGSTLAADLTYAASIESLVAALLSAPEIAVLPAAQREQLATRLVDDTHARYPSLHEDGGPFFQPSAAAALAARRLKTTGPYMAVDAACASSFAALDLAARAIHAGEIEAALVGGCSYNQWSSLVLFSQAQALSPNGSFPFDERADGFVSSDGHAALVLEPLERARAAGRTPLAILRSIGGSCDGRGKSLWAPLKEGQVEAIARAYRDGLSPDSVQVIEAHATGTAVGDATELSALSEVYGRGPGGDRARRPIASVKANIGHTRETAGMAGLIKMILALHKGVVPPAASLQEPAMRWQPAEPVATTPTGSGGLSAISGSDIRWVSWAANSDLATGGALASGGFGIAHRATTAAGDLSTWQNLEFRSLTSTVVDDAVIFPGRSAILSHDNALRYNSAGDTLGEIGRYQGDRLMIPAGASSRIAILDGRVQPAGVWHPDVQHPAGGARPEERGSAGA